MVRPQELIDAVIYTLQQSEQVPKNANFVGYEPDINSESIKLPLIEVSTGPITNANLMNTDLVGFKTDDNGNDIGRVYQSLYTVQLNVAVWTAHGSKYSPRTIGNVVRDELYAHSRKGPAQPLRNSDDTRIDEVWQFVIQDAEQTDDLSTTPTLRRWRQSITISASEEYIVQSDEEVIAAFNENVS